MTHIHYLHCTSEGLHEEPHGEDVVAFALVCVIEAFRAKYHSCAAFKDLQNCAFKRYGLGVHPVSKHDAGVD